MNLGLKHIAPNFRVNVDQYMTGYNDLRPSTPDARPLSYWLHSSVNVDPRVKELMDTIVDRSKDGVLLPFQVLKKEQLIDIRNQVSLLKYVGGGKYEKGESHA